MYVYIKSEPTLWTVGFYNPKNNEWNPESDDIRSDQVAIINDCETSLQYPDLPRFFWSLCTVLTRLVVLKWIPEGFNFQRMYNAVSNGIDVERKLVRDFHIEPRLLFLTEYNPQLVGASGTNRFLTINCSPNYQY